VPAKKVEEILKLAGYRVHTAPDGAAALSALSVAADSVSIAVAP